MAVVVKRLRLAVELLELRHMWCWVAPTGINNSTCILVVSWRFVPFPYPVTHLTLDGCELNLVHKSVIKIYMPI
jgi:hypothetical protein